MTDGKKRTFNVALSMFGEWVDNAIIEIDQRVIDAVDDDWRDVFYELYEQEEIAYHIAYNMLFNHWPLSKLDGWADMPNEYAKITKWPELDKYDMHVTEMIGEKR